MLISKIKFYIICCKIRRDSIEKCQIIASIVSCYIKNLYKKNFLFIIQLFIKKTQSKILILKAYNSLITKCRKDGLLLLNVLRA